MFFPFFAKAFPILVGCRSADTDCVTQQVPRHCDNGYFWGVISFLHCPLLLLDCNLTAGVAIYDDICAAVQVAEDILLHEDTIYNRGFEDQLA